MRIALDLDEVLYDWERTARYMLREYKGYTNLTEVSPIWDYIPKQITAEDWNWLWTEGIKLGLFRYGHVKTGAIIGLNQLIERGHRLVVVTSRPVSAWQDTHDWVDFLKIPFEGVVFAEDKTKVSADLLIDDKPENVVAYLDAGRRAILFDHPWNQGYHRIDHFGDLCYRRAYGWKDVVRAVDIMKEGVTA